VAHSHGKKKKFGTSTTSRIAGGNGGVTVSGGSVSLNQQWQPRVYLMSSTTTHYRFPDLLGHTVRFTVDLRSSTCNCNAALYFVEFPATAKIDDYCDAQGSPACVEIDLLEANTRAFQATAHTAAGNDQGKWGCAWNIKSGQGYGPGGSNIDTNQPYNVDFSFVKTNSKLSGMRVKLWQSGKSNPPTTTLTDSSCSWLGSGYLSSLHSAVTGGRLVLAASYWSGGMDWLDGCSGGVTCPTSSSIIFKDFQIISGITAANADELSNSDDLPFVQSPVFIGIMCAIGILLLVGLIAFIVIRRNNALNQEIV